MIKVNLLSPEKKEISSAGADAPSFEEEREAKLNTTAAAAAAIITVGILGFLYFTQSAILTEKRDHLRERRARKQQLDNVLKKIAELEITKATLEKKVQLITDLKRRQQDAVQMMDELSNALPDWVWLTNLTFANRMLTIKGRTIHNNLISDFINNLKGTGAFYNVNFPGSQRHPQGGLDVFNFTLNCNYKEKEKSTDKTNQK